MWESKKFEIEKKEKFYLGFASNTTIEPLERNYLLVFDDILKVLDGTSERHVLDGVADLARVLEVRSQVGAARLHRLGRVLGFSRIASHLYVCWSLR